MIFPWTVSQPPTGPSTVTFRSLPADAYGVWVVTSCGQLMDERCTIEASALAPIATEESSLGGEVGMLLDGSIRTSSCTTACSFEGGISLTGVTGGLAWKRVESTGGEPYWQGSLVVELGSTKPPFVATEGPRARAILPQVSVFPEREVTVLVGLTGLTGYSLTSGPAPNGPPIVGWPRTTWSFHLQEGTSVAQYVEGSSVLGEQITSFRNFFAGILGGLAMSAIFTGLERRLGWDAPGRDNSIGGIGRVQKADRLRL